MTVRLFAIRLAAVALAAALPAASALAAPASEDTRLERIEKKVRALEDELSTLRKGRQVDEARVEQVEDDLQTLRDLLARVRIGGYGSVRYGVNDLDAEHPTFTFRRLVLTTEAQLAESMRFYTELEYERFRELELERSVEPVAGGLRLEQELEGTSGSEISLEQAWFEWAVDPRLRFRAGGVLVPLGRFNQNHDDNQWNLTRRSLVDRGAPVLPVAAAWDELGAGFNGSFDLGGGLSYDLYVVNGATIDGSLEQIAQTRSPDTNKLALEAKFSPQTGTFSNDIKNEKAVTGRLAWSPVAGNELGFSFYTGRYTPDYLANHRVTSLALDGITRFAGFELEGEVVTTHWEGMKDVARSFAWRAFNPEGALEDTTPDMNLEAEVEFELTNLAKRKTGYWVELRYPFWPDGLPTFGLSRPQLVPVGRFEQVWFDGRLTELQFESGAITALETEDRRLGRGTVGLAFRPTPLVAISAAYEYTWADGSLAGLTNFLAAGDDENHANAFTVGVSFGF